MLVDHFVLGVAALRSIPAINVVYLIGVKRVTAEPTASTTPAPSSPRIRPSGFCSFT